MSDESGTPRTAERLARAARAAQTLSETLWEALHEELAAPDGRRVAELSERLTDVTATVALLARVDSGASATDERSASPAQSGSPAAGRIDEEPSPRVGSSGPPTPSPFARAVDEEQRAPRKLSATLEPHSPAVLVDELAPDAPRAAPATAPSEESARTLREIEIRDERGEDSRRERRHDEDGLDVWVQAIARRLASYERDGLPFGVLLVELADVERLRHAELPGEVSRLTGLVEAALAEALRPADALMRESPGRYWLLAPQTDPGDARALAERLAQAVRGAVSHRGAPLELAIGIAGCPLDGSQAAALAAHAEVALYAARASGRPVA